jgi:hypothetical protein
MNKLVINVLSVILIIFITIAASNHYFINYGYKKPFVEQYKLGYTNGCLENVVGISIVECQMRADDNVNSND